MDILEVALDGCDEHKETTCPIPTFRATNGSIAFRARENIQNLNCRMFADVGIIRTEFPLGCPSGCDSLQTGKSCPIAAGTVVVYDFSIRTGTFFGVVIASCMLPL